MNLTGAAIVGFDVFLRYNRTLLGPQAFDDLSVTFEGGLFDQNNPSLGCYVLPVRRELDLPFGRIRFEAVLFGLDCVVDGNGTLFSIRFQAVEGTRTYVDVIKIIHPEWVSQLRQ